MLSANVLPLYYLSSLAGLVMVVGGIWLLYKEKIYIDRESQQVTAIETPLGTFKTNVPALVLFALGFVPLIYPLYQCGHALSELRLMGRVEGDTFPVQVYAVVGTNSLNRPGDFSLRVPARADYKILYLAPGEPVFDYEPDVREAQNGDLRMPIAELRAGRGQKYQATSLAPVPPGFH